MAHASRKKTRKFLMQKLYARIYSQIDAERFQGAFFDGIFDFSVDEAYLNEMFDLILENHQKILQIIKKYAPKFDIDTMLKTNILAISIAITEMLYLKEEIPAKVSINEAIELAKYYGDEGSKNIVNGILNSFYKDIEQFTKADIKVENNFDFFI